MIERGFDKLYYGFIFIMLSFRIQGIDILPDVIGYILFAYGFSFLSINNYYFEKASKYNVPMIILSIFSIYQKPATDPGFHLGSFGYLGILITIVSFVLNLLIVYNLFMGIKDMADVKGNPDISVESIERWNHYKYLMIAVLFSFILIIIPMLAIVYILVLLIVSIYVLLQILKFIKKCKENLKNLEGS